MTGPSQSKLPSPEPSLHDPALNLLTSIFGGGGTPSFNFMGLNVPGRPGVSTPSGTLQNALTQRIGFTLPPEIVNAFQNMLGQPSATQRTNAATLSMQGKLGGASNIPGFDVLAAAGPVFQRQLTESLARTRNQGPRFSSTGDAQARLLEQQGLQDFNLFSQNVLEQGRNRQLQGLLGYAQANQGQQQLQLQALLPLINALFSGGFSQGTAVGKSPLGQITDLVGAVGGLVTAGKKV